MFTYATWIPAPLFARDPHVTLTNPQISIRNPKSPKSVPETLDSQNSSFDLLSQNHDQNKQSSKPNGSKLFNRFQREEESTNDVLL